MKSLLSHLCPKAFTPHAIANLYAWYDASDAGSIAIESGVSQWNDKSGNGFHATQSTANKQPLHEAGALFERYALAFDGSDDSFIISK